MTRNVPFVFICSTCGKKVEQKAYREGAAKYCSQTCHYAASAGPRINTCLACSEEFTRPNNPNRLYTYCSYSCRAKDRRGAGKGQAERQCAACDQPFLAWPYEVAKGRKYCSKLCSDKAKDEGKTAEAKRVRASKVYSDWRRQVFERDDFTCQSCGARGVRLHADHIKRFADFPELRLDVANGRTLCEDCHRRTPTFGNRRADTKWDVTATGQEA